MSDCGKELRVPYVDVAEHVLDFVDTAHLPMDISIGICSEPYAARVPGLELAVIVTEIMAMEQGPPTSGEELRLQTAINLLGKETVSETAVRYLSAGLDPYYTMRRHSKMAIPRDSAQRH